MKSHRVSVLGGLVYTETTSVVHKVHQWMQDHLSLIIAHLFK